MDRFYGSPIFRFALGVGGLTYGLGVRYLGVSLGSTIILGLCAVFGSIIPSVYYNIFPKTGKDTFSMLLHTHWGQLVLSGIVICVIGIIICGQAGTLKEKELIAGKADVEDNKEYRFGLGILVAIISGVLSACFNFGIEAERIWLIPPTSFGKLVIRNRVISCFKIMYPIVILWGGLTTNFIWCMMLNARNKSFGDYTNKKTPLANNFLFAALAGTTWFFQFFFYGMGESKLGNGASSWILHMAFIILVANAWGLLLKEWKGVSRKAIATLIAGIITIMISVCIVGYGNSIK
jgi:L-rhamnose-H+ transport protein